MTRITTTADLFSEEERIDHLNKFPAYLREDTVELKGSFGTKKYKYINGTWMELSNIKLAE